MSFILLILVQVRVWTGHRWTGDDGQDA